MTDQAQVEPAEVIVFVGPPGAGKSVVGQGVADRLGLPFTDTDARIEKVAGKSISDIFVEDGEAAFRELETAEVLRTLDAQTGVVSLGGGSVLAESVQQALGAHTVVYLQVGISDASGRVGFDTARPLLAVNPRASWVRLLESRRPIYEAVATVTVDTAARTIDEVVTATLEALGRSGDGDQGSTEPRR